MLRRVDLFALEEGQGLAVDFENHPSRIMYKGSMDPPTLYVCHGLSQEEQEAFFAGLAKRTDAWKQFGKKALKS